MADRDGSGDIDHIERLGHIAPSLLFDGLHRAPCGVVVASTEQGGEIAYVNEEFTAITGYTLADVPTVADWVRRAYPDPDYRAMVEANWAEDVTRPDRDVVYRVTCQDGAVKDILLRSGALGQQRMVVMLLDTSARQRAERELRESEQRYRELLASLAAGVVVHVEGRCVFANQTAAQLLAAPSTDALIGHGVLEFVHEADRDAARRRMLALYRKEQQADWVEVRLLTLGGDAFAARLSSSPVDWYGAAASQVLFQDITEEKRRTTERRVFEQRFLQAQKLESLGVLAAGVAHDINNLLVGILGNAELARMELPEDSPARERFEGIRLSSLRAGDLARQMLAYSGRGGVAIAPVDLRPLVEEMAQLLRASVPQKIELVCRLEAELEPIRADATQLSQLVMNLVTNAAEAIGDAAGRITLETRSEQRDDATVSAPYSDRVLAPGRYAVLEISDSGGGMSPDVVQRIFDPFYTTKVSGRGLGLAAVLGIVRGHGGTIEVDTTPGEGSAFRILLPGAEPGEVVFEPDPLEPAPRGRAETVLLVDDEEVVRRIGAQMLQALGHVAVVAAGGRDALKILAEQGDEIHVVVLDVSMPEMDGAETLAALRQICATVPVILSSGYGELEVVERFAGDEHTSFIQKPYQLDSLSVAIDAALKRSRQKPRR